jgi:hypothetical protein
MSEGSRPEERPEAPLPADVPPALRAAVAAALGWLRELEREAESLRRPR